VDTSLLPLVDAFLNDKIEFDFNLSSLKVGFENLGIAQLPAKA